MSFIRVQAGAHGSAGTTFNLPAMGAIPTAGNMIVLLLSWSSGTSGIPAITDDTGGLLTWNVAVSSPYNTGSRAGIAYAYNIPTLSAIPTITATRASTTIGGSAEEWSGFGSNDPLSATASRSMVNTANPTTNTTGAVGELDAVVFAVMQEALVNANSVTVETVVPPWTEIWDASIVSLKGEADYKIVTAGGTQICRWVLGNNSDTVACIAAFVSGNTPTAGVRANQLVQSVATVQAPSPLRFNQETQSAVIQALPVLKWNQVVLTFVVAIPNRCPPETLPNISGVDAGGPALLEATVTPPVCDDPGSMPAITAGGAAALPISVETTTPAPCDTGAIELGPFED
jgi:hypothetical protein